MRRLRKELEAQAGRLKAALRADVPGARQTLRALLAEPLRLHPVLVEGRKAFRFEGQTRIGVLIDPGLYGTGSPGGTRTPDQAVNSRLLYRLSYRGSAERRV